MFARRVQFTGRPAAALLPALLTPLAPAQAAANIPWWVWLILIALLLLLLYWVVTRRQEPEADARLESRQATTPPLAAAPVASPPPPPAPEAPAVEDMAPAPIEPPPPPPPPIPDDLAAIEGIGPKINSILQAAGITTFSQLANTDPGQLRQLLEEADLPMIDPDSWPEQARLAAAGSWQALQELQDRLKAGR
jgi:predicted flap endonuclease-1-like 5' DNA nuclease